MAKVIWTRQAIGDLEEIGGFIARDSEKYAGIVVAELVESIERLKKFPLSGRSIPEVSDEALREIVKLSYRIMYRVHGDTVTIFTVIHARQDVQKRIFGM